MDCLKNRFSCRCHVNLFSLIGQENPVVKKKKKRKLHATTKIFFYRKITWCTYEERRDQQGKMWPTSPQICVLQCKIQRQGDITHQHVFIQASQRYDRNLFHPGGK